MADVELENLSDEALPLAGRLVGPQSKMRVSCYCPTVTELEELERLFAEGKIRIRATPSAIERRFKKLLRRASQPPESPAKT
jgi:hypothetical protein